MQIKPHMKKEYQPIEIVLKPLSLYADVLTGSKDFGTKVESKGDDFGGFNEDDWQ